MPCAKCRDFHCRLDLATPGALSRAIGVIDAGIRGGELAVVAGGPHPSANGPWPDSI